MAKGGSHWFNPPHRKAGLFGREPSGEEAVSEDETGADWVELEAATQQSERKGMEARRIIRGDFIRKDWEQGFCEIEFGAVQTVGGATMRERAWRHG